MSSAYDWRAKAACRDKVVREFDREIVIARYMKEIEE